MDQRDKKIIAPVVILVLLLIYEVGFVLFFCVVPIPLWGKLLGMLLPAGAAGVSIYVFVERIKEIRSGEEDDLSQY